MNTPTNSPLTRRYVLQLAAVGGAAMALPRLARADEPIPGRSVAGPSLPTAADAPGLTGNQPAGFHRVKVGSLAGVVVSDGYATLAPIDQFFAPEAGPGQLATLLTDASLPGDQAVVEFTPVCVQIGAERILIDAGYGSAGMGPTTGALVANLHAAGIRPETITAVIYTHLHGDHLNGAVDDQGRPVYPNAQHFLSKAEHDFWTTNPVNLGDTRLPDEAKPGWIATVQGKLAALKGKLHLLAPGDKILGGLEILFTPGHTPGHISVLVDGGSEQLVVLGDVVHHHLISLARPDWTFNFDVDKKLAVKTRRSILDRLAGDKSRVLAYHLPWPGLGRVVRAGEAFRWDIEPSRR